jgi:hypothetical protein
VVEGCDRAGFAFEAGSDVVTLGDVAGENLRTEFIPGGKRH